MTHRWDAQEYDDRFGFVTAYGAPLLDQLRAVAGERVLDLGCGTGHQGALLAAAGVEVVGVDADPDMLRVARREHARVAGLRFVQADASALTSTHLGGPVDAVLSNAALHWMTDQAEVLARVRSVMRPGGRFVAEMGGVGNVARVRLAMAGGVAAVTGRPEDGVRSVIDARSWFPTPGRQSTLLEESGFVVRTMALVDRPTPLPGTVSDWAAHFRPDVLALGSPSQIDAVRAEIDRRAAGLGLHGPDGWFADYVRLRFVAVAA